MQTKEKELKLKENKKNANYSVPAVDGMLDIVEFLSEHRYPCGVTELSRELGLSTNLVFRIMKRLVERGYVQLESSSLYQLSNGFYTLGMKLHSRFDLRKQARVYLEELCAKTGETTQIQVPDGKKMQVMDVVTPDNSYYLQVIPGSRLYYHANAFGKCVLAYVDEEKRRSLLSEGLPELTSKTVTSLSLLEEELKSVRKTGFAYDRGEYLQGIYCIGAPVFNADGEVIAGVGTTCLATRFEKTKLAEFKKAVGECASAISKAIGYTPK